jgi:hypothetical protein
LHSVKQEVTFELEDNKMQFSGLLSCFISRQNCDIISRNVEKEELHIAFIHFSLETGRQTVSPQKKEPFSPYTPYSTLEV